MTPCFFSFSLSEDIEGFSANVGEHDLGSPTGTTVSFSRMEMHPDWDSSSNNNDIALLEVSGSIELNENVRGACQATQSQGFYVNKRVTISGWGNTISGE